MIQPDHEWFCPYCGTKLTFDVGRDEMSDGTAQADPTYFCGGCERAFEVRTVRGLPPDFEQHQGEE